MNTTHSFTSALRTMLDTKPYHKITVQDLCDTANLSRRTFYKHFSDKDAATQAMIREDYVEPSVAMRSIMVLEEFKSSSMLLTEQVYKTVLENRERYSNLLKNLGKLRLVEMICAVNHLFTTSFFDNYEYAQAEMDYASFLMATVTATTTVRWIENDFDLTPYTMAQYYNNWVMAHWRELGFPQK